MIQDRICGRQTGDSGEYLIEYLAGRQMIQTDISSNI